MVDSSGDRWLSVSEAARQLGVSRQALHHRIKRGTLQVQVNNHGQRLVKVLTQVPRAVTGSNPSVTIDEAEPSHPAPHAPESVPLSVHQGTIAALQAAHAGELARLLDQTSAERQMLVERIDAAELRLEQVLEVILEDRRPWWSRWFGASRRSAIRGGQ